MKSLKLFLMFFLFISFEILSQTTYDMNVIMIGIGGKNPTFDESKFPNLQFYYTPEMISQAEVGDEAKAAVALLGGSTREVFAGKPEILEEWYDELDLRNYALLFDKNGVGTWQGKLDLEDHMIEDSEGQGEEESLEDTFEFLFDDGEEMEFDDGKEFDYEDDDCIIETKMPDFEVVAVDGSKKSIKSLVENGKTTMVVFFQISKDMDLNAAEEVKEEEGIGGFFGGVAKSMAGYSWQQLMKQLEFYIYGNEVEVKMAGDKN